MFHYAIFIPGVAHVVRGCYARDALPGLNWTNGCRDWTNDVGYTALYCFCDIDMCNASERSFGVAERALLAVVIAFNFLLAI
jgi:hypothetical protein